MTRRAFLAGGLALACTLAAGQGASMRRVAYLSVGGSLKGLAAGLASLGWVEGRNLRLERRVPTEPGGRAQVDAAARELLAGEPDVVVAFLRDQVAAIARANATVPIVAALHDPVLDGFAKSHARPGGRVTGVAFSSPEGVKMSFRLLGAVMPRLERIHALGPTGFHETPTVVSTRRGITEEKGYVFVPHVVATHHDAVRVVQSIRERAAEAVAVAHVPDLDYAALGAAVLQARVAVLDTTGRMPTGSLLSAGLYHRDLWGRMAAIVDQVLRGVDPAVIPFEQPTHAEVVLNRRTAAAIGMAFPEEVLMRATKIID